MGTLPKALLIEDDSSTAALIKESLSPLIQLSWFANGEEGLEQLDEVNPNIILLDLNLPDYSGIQLLQKIRSNQNYKNTPILIITGSSNPQDELQGHEFGATEYLKKPLDPKLIKIIVEKNLVSSMSTSSEVLSFNGISVNLKSMEASILESGEDKSIDLTQKELKILIILLEEKERVLSKEKIFEKVWSEESESMVRTVEMHVSSLRKKLGPLADNIKTIRGIGYTLK